MTRSPHQRPHHLPRPAGRNIRNPLAPALSRPAAGQVKHAADIAAGFAGQLSRAAGQYNRSCPGRPWPRVPLSVACAISRTPRTQTSRKSSNRVRQRISAGQRHFDSCRGRECCKTVGSAYVGSNPTPATQHLPPHFRSSKPVSSCDDTGFCVPVRAVRGPLVKVFGPAAGQIRRVVAVRILHLSRISDWREDVCARAASAWSAGRAGKARTHGGRRARPSCGWCNRWLRAESRLV